MTICYFHEGTHLVTSDAVDQGDTLLIPALLSRTGSYPDKNVSFSAADFDRAIARFSSLPLPEDHVRTLKTHWNLSQQFPADDGNRQLKGTLRMLEHLDSGSRILDSIVNPEGK